jgi:hypothetical protein
MHGLFFLFVKGGAMKKIFVVLAVLFLLAIVACSGGGGGSSTPTVEDDVKTKAKNMLPPAEYSILETNLTNVKNDPNYNDYLNQLNQALDNFSNAFNAVQQKKAEKKTQKAEVHIRASMTDNMKSYVNQMKVTLNTMFGDITTNAKKTFLNAGMGYSRGVLGGPGGDISATVGVGVGIEINSGSGSEQVYDFLHFQKANFPVSECGGGLTISLGEGGGFSGNVEAAYYENWIFGFKNNIGDYTGPAQGGSISGGVEGALGVGLGINGSFGGWTGYNGSCTLGACPVNMSTDKSGMTAINYAVGVSGSTGVEEKAEGAFSVEYTQSCTGAASGKTDFLDLNLPPSIRYTIAGIHMATDILTASNFSAFSIPAAATAVLYGLNYDDSLIEHIIIEHIITGQVTLNGGGLSGVTMTLTGNFASYVPVQTGSDGSYTFTNAANGDYTVTPSKTGYTFSPSNTAVTVSGANKPNINFTATANTAPVYTISGQVSGAVVSGVTITLTGNIGSGSATTDSGGNYGFSGIANGDTCTITPSKAGYTFSPISRSVTVSGANVSGINFTATASSTSLPNLTPYLSSGWSDKIVVSTNTGDHVDATTLTSNDNLYVDWAYINNGNADVTQDHSVKLYVDGVLNNTWSGCNPLQMTYMCSVNDYNLGQLSCGTHTLTMVVDADNQITESNENDNEYTKTINVFCSISNGTLTGINGYNIAAIIDASPNYGVKDTPLFITITFTSGASFVNDVLLYQTSEYYGWQFGAPSTDMPMTQISQAVWQNGVDFVLTGTYGVIRFYAVTSSGTKVAVGDIWLNGSPRTVPDWQHDGIGTGTKGGLTVLKSSTGHGPASPVKK